MDLDGNIFDEEWLRSSHTLHTEIDPSLRSLTACIMRNGELAAAPRTLKRWKDQGIHLPPTVTDRLDVPHNKGNFSITRTPYDVTREKLNERVTFDKDFGEWMPATDKVCRTRGGRNATLNGHASSNHTLCLGGCILGE